MIEVLINSKKYVFIKDYKVNSLLRKSYNALTQKTYGFDFEQWYEEGYWGSWYIPYSLFDGENIVANVAVSVIDFLVLGEVKRYIQIGTVMTDLAYRNQGLAKYLMELVINEWKDKCDMIFLFANNNVLKFYPKFGFVAVDEYQYYKAIRNDNEFMKAEQLDMSLKSSKQLVEEKVTNSVSMSKLMMLKNVGLIMFYCTSFMRNNVYYLREQDVIVIAEFKDNTLYLYDIFCSSKVDLDNIIESLTNKEIEKVVLGFTPNIVDNYNVKLIDNRDTILFVLKNKDDLFLCNKLMFPELSHA